MCCFCLFVYTVCLLVCVPVFRLLICDGVSVLCAVSVGDLFCVVVCLPFAVEVFCVSSRYCGVCTLGWLMVRVFVCGSVCVCCIV